MDDIWIISWFNHIAFDANRIWRSPIARPENRLLLALDMSLLTVKWASYGMPVLCFQDAEEEAPGPQGTLGKPRTFEYFARFLWYFLDF